MAFEFKIQLRGTSKPPVWRRLKVPENWTFIRFHLAIQRAFGWYNCHLFSFSPSVYNNDYEIQLPYEDAWEDPGVEIKSANKIKLKDIFKTEKQTFIYIYDFGDSWEHKITLEKITSEKINKATCLGGKGKCPPEDCGGIYGYQKFLETLRDPHHPEYEETRTWACLDDGEEWDVNEFSIEQVNERL
ncbi:MAG: plasmid pRiA4b ORF-3 family protein [Chitinophagaceae bacterium]